MQPVKGFAEVAADRLLKPVMDSVMACGRPAAEPLRLADVFQRRHPRTLAGCILASELIEHPGDIQPRSTAFFVA